MPPCARGAEPPLPQPDPPCPPSTTPRPCSPRPNAPGTPPRPSACAAASRRRRLLLPQEFCAPFDHHPQRPDFAGIYRTCLEQLQRADAVLCVLDGADADSGTCFEVGYAVARGIPVIALRTDWRPAEDGGGNCMLTRSCRALCRSLAEAEQALMALLDGAPARPHAAAPPR